MPSALETAADRFRAELLRSERAAASAMVNAYGEAWQRVSQRIADLQAQIATAQAAGADISPSWFFQFDRLSSLQAQIESELRRFAVSAFDATLALQSEAVQAAGRHAADLAQLAAGPRVPGLEVPFDTLPSGALQELVGAAADGSPLREVFGGISRGVADRVTQSLAASVAAGLGPRETARVLRRQFGVGLARALLISRTETLRAYREATHRNFLNNRDVLEGWVWKAALGPRTCPACWAMHGTFHRLEERLDDHPNGRCTMLPRTKSWATLGYNVPDNRPTVEKGADIFARLTAAEQRAILGRAAHAAYARGAVSLEQFAAIRHSDDWGDTLAVQSLRTLVGAEEAQKYRYRRNE
jgi:SPP1 gp7 family putative phage head morphogenesis protein